MSPLVWDLGHIAAFEDLWVCRDTGLDLLRPELSEVYDAAETPRAERGELSYLRRAQALDYMEAVRERTLSVLGRLSEHITELLVRHEQQHDETMLQTLQLARRGVFAPERRERAAGGAAATGAWRIDGGPFELGAGGEGFAYDNERPRHAVELDSY